MRLTTLLTADGPRVGIADGEGDDLVIKLLGAGPTLLDVVQGGAEALADVNRRVRTVVPASEAVFGPLLSPPSVRDFLTYERHLAALAGEVPDSWYEEPLFYFSNPAAIVAPTARWPFRRG